MDDWTAFLGPVGPLPELDLEVGGEGRGSFWFNEYVRLRFRGSFIVRGDGDLGDLGGER